MQTKVEQKVTVHILHFGFVGSGLLRDDHLRRSEFPEFSRV